MKIIASSGLDQNHRGQPHFVTEYYEFLKQPGVTEHVQQLQSEVIQDCHHIIRSIEIPALQANNLFWQQSTEKR